MTRVLIIESDRAFAQSIESGLGAAGCSVEVADGGDLGVQAAVRQKPDLILISLELPDAHGFAVCSRFRRDAQFKDIPLVIVSSEANEDTFEVHRHLPSRANDYIRKPIGFKELLHRLQPLVPIGKPTVSTMSEPPEELDELDVEPVSEDWNDEKTSVFDANRVEEALKEAEASAARPTREESAPAEAAPVESVEDKPGPPEPTAAPVEPSPTANTVEAAPVPEPSPSPPVVAEPEAKPDRANKDKRAAAPQKTARAGKDSPEARQATAALSKRESDSGGKSRDELAALVASLQADKELAAKRAEDVKARLARNEGLYDKLQAQVTQSRQALGNAEAVHKQNLRQLQTAHQQELAAARVIASQEVKVAEAAAEERMQKLRDEHAAALLAAEALRAADAQSHAESLRAAEAALQARLREFEEAFRAETRRIGADHVSELGRLQGVHEHEIAQVKKALEDADERKAQALAAAEDQHKAAIGRLRQEHERELQQAADELRQEQDRKARRAARSRTGNRTHPRGTSRCAAPGVGAATRPGARGRRKVAPGARARARGARNRCRAMEDRSAGSSAPGRGAEAA